MMRDITMIVSVCISVASLSFGLYKNIEAGNAKGFAYEQAYRVLNIVQRANITPYQRATIADAALTAMGTPPPVIDLSRSSAAVPASQICTTPQQSQCTTLLADLATANSACKRANTAVCTDADVIHRTIIQQDCIRCFTP